MQYKAEIDGLRALALFAVILFHAGLHYFKGGFVGVDIFFVISGYLITNIIINDIRKGKFSLISFYHKRARRLIPALFFVMFCAIPFSWFFLPPMDMLKFSKSFLATPLFLSNFLFYKESSYFDTFAELKPFLHTWSLGVEAQFYFFFPFFLIFIFSLGKKNMKIIIIILATLSLIIAFFINKINSSFTFYMLPTRGFELLIGSFVSLLVHYKSRIISFSYILGNLLSLLGIILIIYSILIFDKYTPHPSFYTLMPVIGTGLILAFIDKKNLVSILLRQKFLVGFGLISYSVYLWHYPILSFAKQVIPSLTGLIIFFLISLSILLGYLSWKYIEKPFREKDKINGNNALLLLVIFTSIFFLFGIKGYFSNGYSNRKGMEIYEDLNNDISKLGYKKCVSNELFEGEKIEYCYESNNGPINAAIIGDSHAMDKFYGIEKNITNLNWALIGSSSCPPVLNIDVESDAKNCRIKSEKIINYVVDNTKINTVILSFYGNYFLSESYAADHIANRFGPDMIKISSDKILSNDRREIFFFGLSETIRKLIDNNKKVYLLIDVPELPFFPVNCIKGFEGKCQVPFNEVFERQSQQRKVFKKLEQIFPEIKIFDPIDLFCNNNICSIKKDGRILYSDSHHLSLFGSDLYGKKLKLKFSN